MTKLNIDSFLALVGITEFFLVLIVLLPMIRTIRHLLSTDMTSGLAYMGAATIVLAVWPQVLVSFIFGPNAFEESSLSHLLLDGYFGWFAEWAHIFTSRVFLFAFVIVNFHVIVPLAVYGFSKKQ